jgi:hypothetical protein
MKGRDIRIPRGDPGRIVGRPRTRDGPVLKARFCPGYSVARSCDRRCALCKHVIVEDLPRWLVPPTLPGQCLPVRGRGTLEDVRVIVEEERTTRHAS